ncbi:carboxylesterase family protein [Streptomyces sp. L7]
MLSNAMNRRTFLNGTLTAAADGRTRRHRDSAPTRRADDNSATALDRPAAHRHRPGVRRGVPGLRRHRVQGPALRGDHGGRHRWRPPQPADSLDGVRVADTFGDICPQQVMGSASVTMSEDCLNLNVWTGAASSLARSARSSSGSTAAGSPAAYASDPASTGAGLAAKGLVVVTLNYRTGAFGFLATPNSAPSPATTPPATTVSSTRFLGPALEVIRRNTVVRRRPEPWVTIAGQSAGRRLRDSTPLHLLPARQGPVPGRDLGESGGARRRRRPRAESAALAARRARTSRRPSWHRVTPLALACAGLGIDAGRRAVASEHRADGGSERQRHHGVSGPGNGNPPEFRPVLDGCGAVRRGRTEQALADGHLNRRTGTRRRQQGRERRLPEPREQS